MNGVTATKLKLQTHQCYGMVKTFVQVFVVQYAPTFGTL